MKKKLLISLTIGLLFIAFIVLYTFFSKVTETKYCKQFEEQIDTQGRYTCSVAGELQRQGRTYIRLNISSKAPSKLEAPSYKINKQTLEVTRWEE